MFKISLFFLQVFREKKRILRINRIFLVKDIEDFDHTCFVVAGNSFLVHTFGVVVHKLVAHKLEFAAHT